jgi:Raf kinase inhibitor-like YbhB/YbcL family protein
MSQIETGNAMSKAKRLEVTSTAFGDGERIPVRFTADGENVSPPLRWGDPPAGTRGLAIVCEDPDAPSGLFVHWTAWNIPANRRELTAGVAPSAEVSGMRQGRNGFGDTGYGGPSPPPGKPHRYRFRIFALDAPLDLPPGASRGELDRAMEGHVLAAGMVVGRYER